MKDNSLSLSKIYGTDSVPSLHNRINFIASKPKKQWISIQDTTSSAHTHTHLDGPPKENVTTARRFCHSKVKSMELQQLKTRRYQQGRQDSETIMVRAG
jgi:hypothetical protein